MLSKIVTWYRKLWQRLADKFIDHWLDLIVIGVSAAVVLLAKDWLLTPIPVWSIVLVAGGPLISFLVVRLFKLRQKSFRSFRVFDTDLETICWVQNDPRHWIESTFDRNYPDTYTSSLLDGPYCGRIRENGDHCLGDFSRRAESRRQRVDSELSDRCHICKRGLFEDEEGNPLKVKLSVPELKLLVIHALQREYRRGRKIRRDFRFGVVDQTAQ